MWIYSENSHPRCHNNFLFMWIQKGGKVDWLFIMHLVQYSDSPDTVSRFYNLSFDPYKTAPFLLFFFAPTDERYNIVQDIEVSPISGFASIMRFTNVTFYNTRFPTLCSYPPIFLLCPLIVDSTLPWVHYHPRFDTIPNTRISLFYGIDLNKSLPYCYVGIWRMRSSSKYNLLIGWRPFAAVHYWSESSTSFVISL